MHIVIYLSSEVKPSLFCEHKALFASDSCNLQIFDFIQALSKQFNRNWVYFMFYSRTSISFDFNQNWVKSVTNHHRVIIVFFLDVIIIYIVIEYIIDYFVLIQTPFQVFESTTVCVIRKYKFKEVACLDVLFRALDITTSSGE